MAKITTTHLKCDYAFAGTLFGFAMNVAIMNIWKALCIELAVLAFITMLVFSVVLVLSIWK
jgi:hypothetical protein